MTVKLFLFVFISCLIHSVVGYGSGISSAVFSLPHFQAENGGFTSAITEGAPGNLDDTTHALFLASLFGTRDKVAVNAAASFISSLQNPDYGYGDQPGKSSSLESVKNALLSSLYLGSLPPDTSGIVNFVQSLYDNNAKLYRNAAGKIADYKATATALEIFNILEFSSPEVAERKEEIKAKLASAVKVESDTLSFSAITSDNSFAIIAAHLAGYDFEDVSQWIAYYKNRQVPSGAKKGAFYSDDFATDAEIYDVDYGIHALYLLNGKQLVPNTLINLPSLTGYLNSLPPELANAGHAFSALARTTGFKDFWKLTATYAIKEGGFKITPERIVQGTSFRPHVYFRTTTGQSHSAVFATATITHALAAPKTFTFKYNTQNHMYESEEFFDTEGLFGPVSLEFSVRWAVPGFEEINFTFTERKSIGFDVSIGATASYADDEWSPMETVGLGAEFNFKIFFGTVATPKPGLVSGDFVVTFTVFDSSNAVVHTDELDGAENSDPISFKFVLEDSDVPAGRLVFRFVVNNADGPHTYEEVWYNLKAVMVASQIEFEQDQTVNFGSEFEVVMTPATLSADGRVHTYPQGTRKFFLDIFSEKNHVLLAVFPGTAQTSNAETSYSFQVKIPSRFDLVGVNVLSFRYQDIYGNDLVLKNFDSEQSELFQEDLKYTVETHLELTDIMNSPTPGDLIYGDRINFSFKIQDTWSDTPVSRGGLDSTVFLGLQHVKDDATFFSSKVRAKPDQSGFTVDWYVDPNAIKGPAKLVLYFLDGDQNVVPLNFDSEPWEIDVTIRGDLEIDQQSYSAPFDETDTSFLVAFVLRTLDTKMPGAELTARVRYGTQQISVIPVATGQDGSYQVSWFLHTKDANTGDYSVDIYRNVDLKRNASDPFSASPFFTIPVHHEGIAYTPLPFKTEFVVLLILSVSLVVASVRKVELEKKN